MDGNANSTMINEPRISNDPAPTMTAEEWFRRKEADMAAKSKQILSKLAILEPERERTRKRVQRGLKRRA